MYKNFTIPICGDLPIFTNKRKLAMQLNLFSFLLLFAILQVSAKSLAQPFVNIDEKETTLKEVFQEIKRQTGYHVLYSPQKVNDNKKINISLKNASLEKVLESSLAGESLSFSIRANTIMIREAEKTVKVMTNNLPSEKLRSAEIALQDIITGRVTDSLGSPMAGVNVEVKGSTQQTTTDADGRFFVRLNGKATLVFSILGYKRTEVKIDGSKPINVTLLPISTELEEVTITTAYGIERRTKELGYSVGRVTGEELNRANSGNILNGLIGKVSGLNIGTQSSEMAPQMRVLLRGIRSFGESSNNQPLFVFNGAPLSFGSDINAAQRANEFINNLNPSDIEDVTILKGANGSAMYGPEGVNGVIIITTKKVKDGEFSVNARVNTSFNRMDFRQRTDQRTFGVGDAADQLSIGGNSVNNWGPAYDGRMIGIGYPDENGELQYVPYMDLNDRYDFFNVARTTRTNVSVSQGNENSSLYFGFGRVDQTGLLPGDNQNQNTILITSDKKIGNAANLQFNVNYTRSASDRGGDVTSAVLNLPSFIPLLSYRDYENSHWGNINNYWSGINPYAQLGTQREKTTDNTLTGSFIANVKILPWLNVKNQISMNYAGRDRKKNTEPVVFADYARADSRKRNDREPATEDLMNAYYGVNNDLMVSAIHKTGDFLIRGNLGNTIRDNFGKEVKTGGILVIPVYNSIFTRSDLGNSVVEITQQTRSISVLGNFSLGYKDMAFLELTGRNEWDSKRAGVARGKDFYFGANTSFVLKDMIPYLKEQGWLSNFRLRLSATRTANMNIEPQQSERILTLVHPYPYTNPATGKSVLGYGIFSNPNPFIRPEKVFSQEYGTEIGFLNNRIRFDAAYYTQVNDGIIMRVGVPAYSGYPDLDNAGRFRNTGWEFDLNLNPLVDFGNNINISLIGRFSINNNKVLEVSDIYDGTFIARDPGGNLFYAREGHSAFEFPVLDFMRDPGGRVIVDAKTGMPTVDYANPKITGKTLPVYQGGFTLNFQYKNFTLSGQADYSAGNHHAFNGSLIRNGTSAITLMNNREVFVFPNSVIEVSPGEFVENHNVAVSNAGNELFSRFADATIHTISSANYWKIREVALQYDLPVNRKFIKRVSASVYGRDLFSFYPPSNIYGDPVATNGPGLRTSQPSAVGGRPPSQTNNVSGSAADGNVAPGTILYGFTFGISF